MTTERRTPQCLSDETLAAFIDGRLTPGARAEAMAHLATCDVCAEALSDSATLLVELEALEPAAVRPATLPPAPVVSAPVTMTPRASSGGRRTWTWAVVGLAAAAVIVFAVAGPKFLRDALSTQGRPELSELVAAVGTSRPIEGRLTGGFKYGTAPAPLRSTNETTAVSPETQIAVAHLKQALDRTRDASTLAAYASGALAEGRLDDAIASLEQATALDPKNADAWSDLSAAYLARGQQAAHAVDVPSAIEAAATAVRLDPSLREAAFNHALALERTSIRQQAVDAWQHYLSLDPSSPWATEARQHLAALQAPKAAGFDPQGARDQLFDSTLPKWAGARNEEAWQAVRQAVDRLDQAAPGDRLAHDVVDAIAPKASDASLLEGLRAYGEGRRLYAATKYHDAQPYFIKAASALAYAHNPLGDQAAFNQHVCEYQDRQLSDAARGFAALASRIDAARYPSLAGRVAWMQGQTSVTQNRRDGVDAQFAASLSALGRAGEIRNAAFVLGLVASYRGALGDLPGAWAGKLKALAIDQRYGALTATSAWAVRSGWPETGVALANEAVTISRSANRPIDLADSLRARALARAAIADRAGAREDLAEARRLGNDTTGWAALTAELDAVEAQVADTAQAPAGIAAADRAIDYYTTQHVNGRLPVVLLARATLFRVTHTIGRARDDLSRALELLESERATVAAADLRATFGSDLHDVGEALADLELSANHDAAAFDALERVRAAALAKDATAARSTLADVQQLLAADTALVFYEVGRARSSAWIVRQHQTSRVDLRDNEDGLQRLVTAWLGDPDSPALARAVSDSVLAPVQSQLEGATCVVVIPDGPLGLVSFDALPADGSRRWVDRAAVLMAPSATWWVRATRRAASAPMPTSIAAFGNPLIDASRFPSLAMLPGASREAALAAAPYREQEILTESQATRASLLEALSSRDVVHFAGHTMLNDFHPLESELVVSDPQHQPLTAGDLAGVENPRARLVVLSSCTSAGGRLVRGEGPLGVTRALLASGVDAVIASQWPVRDNATQALFTRFHIEYSRSGNALAALRTAQLELAHSADPALNRPSAWGAFVVIGGLRSGTHASSGL